MAELPTQGKIEAQEGANGALILVPLLYPRLDDGQTLTSAFLCNLLNAMRVKEGLSEKACELLTQIVVREHRTYERAILAQGIIPFRRGVDKLTIPFTDIPAPEDFLNWRLIDISYEQYQEGDAIPIRTRFVHAGELLGEKALREEEAVGRSVYGEEIHAPRAQTFEYRAGENVRYEERTRTFTARVCGYLLIREQDISVLPALRMTDDKMRVEFSNLPRINMDDFPNPNDLDAWIKINRAEPERTIIPTTGSCPANEPITVIEGKFPGESSDGSIEFHIEMSHDSLQADEHDRFDYRERNLYKSVTTGMLIATRTLPAQGENGTDLFRTVVKSRVPQDAILKNGPGIRLEKDDKTVRFYAMEDGVIDYKNDILTVFPVLKIPGDVDMSVGNIDAKANLEIGGTVLTGFKIKSEKNIVIRGNVEEDCLIECAGNLTILGGVIGEHTRIQCGGALTAKYLDGCTVKAGGQVSIQRYVSRAEVECGDNLVIFGAAINLDERGAVVNSTLKVRKRLYVPVIGSDAGLKSSIHFAYDPVLDAKIAQLHENCAKITTNIAEVKEQFTFDIANPQVYNQIKGFTQERRDAVIQAIQEKNRLEKQIEMMKKILDGELAKKKALLEESRVEVQRKIVPELIMYANDMQLTIDKYQGPSLIYYDFETRLIERIALVGHSPFGAH
jgi:uncharacterized protein (DUF342 family)